MGAVRTYIVTQTREVKVRANNPTSAVYLATTVFETEEQILQNVEGGVISDVKETEITAREEF